MLEVEFHTNLSCGDIAESNAMHTAAGSEIINGNERLILMFEKIERISDPENPVINDCIQSNEKIVIQF